MTNVVEISAVPSVTVEVVADAVTVTTTTPAASVIVESNSGPQGIPGGQGPTGPVAVPNFYESSTPPLGPDRGDQWIVTTELGG